MPVLLIFYQTILFSILLIVGAILRIYNGSLFHLNSIWSFFMSYFIDALALLFLVYVYKRYNTISFKRRIIASILSFLLSFVLMFIFLSVLEKLF
ncbi:hypothetical protein GGQ95_003736 [Anoxybacillus rupiensis]|nr:hypothetical protein [Anoxybacillus rupiensis]